ncbi:hypothetical protein, partial [Polymorphobacter multimanifer]|uniref:hypothetical protein n=2 Tax=Pseudomonadota TaxID=1224 RepID=UPI001A9C5508
IGWKCCIIHCLIQASSLSPFIFQLFSITADVIVYQRCKNLSVTEGFRGFYKQNFRYEIEQSPQLRIWKFGKK